MVEIGASWGTRSEMEFVRSLGTGKYKKPELPRHTLLENYLETFEDREEWGSINKYDVFIFASHELQEARKKWTKLRKTA